jgi:hypothetical protein
LPEWGPNFGRQNDVGSPGSYFLAGAAIDVKAHDWIAARVESVRPCVACHLNSHVINSAMTAQNAAVGPSQQIAVSQPG